MDFRKVKLSVASLSYWIPVDWPLWNEESAIPAHLPEDMWRTHNGHEAAMSMSALGVNQFHCFDCNYHWKRVDG